jgi:PIN domain nuclease of toxin-antitoxin system
MKALLDTHVFLWVMMGDSRLSEKAQKAYLDPQNSIFFSAASFWEVGIKMSLGKLSLKDGWMKSFEDQMKINTIQWLPIERLHCEEVSKLPFHHRDPFDRMLIAQALVEDLALISGDPRFADYGVNCLW